MKSLDTCISARVLNRMHRCTRRFYLGLGISFSVSLPRSLFAGCACFRRNAVFTCPSDPPVRSRHAETHRSSLSSALFSFLPSSVAIVMEKARDALWNQDQRVKNRLGFWTRSSFCGIYGFASRRVVFFDEMLIPFYMTVTILRWNRHRADVTVYETRSLLPFVIITVHERG